MVTQCKRLPPKEAKPSVKLGVGFLGRTASVSTSSRLQLSAAFLFPLQWTSLSSSFVQKGTCQQAAECGLFISGLPRCISFGVVGGGPAISLFQVPVQSTS